MVKAFNIVKVNGLDEAKNCIINKEPFTGSNIMGVNLNNKFIVYSYATPICIVDQNNVFLNITKYSKTTSKLQNAIKALYGCKVSTVSESDVGKLIG